MSPALAGEFFTSWARRQRENQMQAPISFQEVFWQKEREVFLINDPHALQALKGEEQIETEFNLNTIHNPLKSRPTV